MANSIEVVYTPALLPMHEVKGKTVVVIDILRATTSICVAFQTGAAKILPVATPEECRVFKEFDFLCAAERNALKLDGFDLGNSPFEYQNPLIAGRNIALTTTNGTKAIKMAKELQASNILIGSFLNLSALCDKLSTLAESVILLCAGWKDRFNLEDTLFAGALVNELSAIFETDCDAALAARELYLSMQDNLEHWVRQSSHAKRFQLLHLQTDDVAFCLQRNSVNLVPMLQGEYIII
ncbi:MAG: 2-phosphosulfolactate phosphatase [Bacteroidota bacterium]|jgi:2-phosphosulfolactate phosphatase